MICGAMETTLEKCPKFGLNTGPKSGLDQAWVRLGAVIRGWPGLGGRGADGALCCQPRRSADNILFLLICFSVLCVRYYL